jgi:predicted negative regulator of RcsB-dependent stress response
MKSAHRHELETNALAQRLEVLIDRIRPYSSTIVGAIAAAVILILAWSWFSNSRSARSGSAWNEYHSAVGAVRPDLNRLQQFAEEHPGTEMQQLANITLADGKVFDASMNYFYNREVAREALNHATSAYQSVLRTSDNERLLNRARLGLARVYEMQNEPEKARQEYLKVGGGYAEFAKRQVERLEKPETKETFEWLAKAEPPRTLPPIGPGTPGTGPEFSPGDLSLPEGTPLPDANEDSTSPATSFDDILKGLKLQMPSAEGQDRTGTGLGTPMTTEEPPAADAPAGAAASTNTNTAQPATNADSTQPAAEAPATPAEKLAE